MLRRLGFAFVVLALAAPGCTLLINANQYVGNGTGNDGGPGTDANVDAGPGHDGGPHGNTAPTLVGVGLDDYRPIVGETVHAIPGRAFDPEGDPTSVHLQWYVNGTMQAGATSSTLMTASLTAGDMIHVEAWVNDGMLDSPHVQTSDVPVLENVTRWRQLLPAESDRLPLMVWDTPNRRAVRYVDGNVWEYTIEGSSLRAAMLPTTGTPPPSVDDAVTFHDEDRHRMIVYTGADPTNIYALDISHRGGAAWTQIATTGPTPSTTLLSTTFYDPSSHHAYLVGGKDDTEGALFQFFELDLSSAGGETWSTPAMLGTSVPRVMATAVASDPTTPGRFYLLGGQTSTVGTSTVDPVYSQLDHVVQLDVQASGVMVTERSGTAPSFWGAVAASLPSGRVIVYGGLTVFGPGAAVVAPQIYDIASDGFSALPGTAHGALFGTMATDPTAPNQLVSFTIGADIFAGPSDDAMTFQVDTLTEAGVTMVAQRIAPRTVYDAAATTEGNTLRIVGGQSRGAVVGTNYALDLSTLQWSHLVTHDDTATSHHPDARYGVRSDPSGFNGGPIFQVGGGRAASVLADMGAFELQSDGTWLERSLTSGTAPPSRVGHVVTSGSCGSTRLLAYGGEDALGNPLGDALELDCTTDHSCTWTSAAIDAGRSYASGFTWSNQLYVFGGRTPSGPANDVFVLTSCSGSAATTVPFSTSGPAPTPRHSATITAITDPTGTHTSGLVFGGYDGTFAFNDLTALDLDATGSSGSWRGVVAQGDLPNPRYAHVAVYDVTNRRVIVVGGYVPLSTDPYEADDVWELLLGP